MPLTLEWYDVALRLALTLLAGALLGFNRSERGRPAGLRTTTLVCLAASVSMIQVNLLLNLPGKAPDSFAVMDLMRLPLGILTGMGFIGGGAILRRGNVVQGVTTAATLWLATVLGLCLGGGQLGLGLAGLGLGLAILWGLKVLEQRLWVDRRGTLTVAVDTGGPTDGQLRGTIQAAGYSVSS
jgi:putative Mg2+ transporter-C (MgtC) family protein